MIGDAKFGGGILLGGEVKMDGLAFFPERRDLEDGGTAEPTMSEEHFFAEGVIVGGGDHFGGDTGKLGVTPVIGAIENEGNESGARGNEWMAKLAGQLVAEGGGAHFRDGETSCGDDQSGRAKFDGTGAQDEFGDPPDFSNARIQEDLHVGSATFGFEHVGDSGGGIIAEELAESFFVISDVMFFDEGEKIGGREAGKRGFGEVGIGRNEVIRFGVNVGEIAAAAAGNEDFLADTVGVLKDSDAPAPVPCLDGAKEACGASA